MPDKFGQLQTYFCLKMHPSKDTDLLLSLHFVSLYCSRIHIKETNQMEPIYPHHIIMDFHCFGFLLI